MRTVSVLKGFHKRGVICVDFSGTYWSTLQVLMSHKTHTVGAHPCFHNMEHVWGLSQGYPGQYLVLVSLSKDVFERLTLTGSGICIFLGQQFHQNCWLNCLYSSEVSCIREKLLAITNLVQSNLCNMDTKGTEPSVRFTEVSVLKRQGMYDFWHFWDQTNCP